MAGRGWAWLLLAVAAAAAVGAVGAANVVPPTKASDTARAVGVNELAPPPARAWRCSS